MWCTFLHKMTIIAHEPREKKNRLDKERINCATGKQSL